MKIIGMPSAWERNFSTLTFHTQYPTLRGILYDFENDEATIESTNLN